MDLFSFLGKPIAGAAVRFG